MKSVLNTVTFAIWENSIGIFTRKRFSPLHCIHCTRITISYVSSEMLYKRKKTCLNPSLPRLARILMGGPPRVPLITPLPGWMLRQEQWRLTWLTWPLVPSPRHTSPHPCRVLRGKPTNLLPVLIRSGVSVSSLRGNACVCSAAPFRFLGSRSGVSCCVVPLLRVPGGKNAATTCEKIRSEHR